MLQSSKHLSEVQSCYLTKSTLPLTKSSAFRASLREMVFSLKRLEDSLNQDPGFNVFATANTKGKGSDDGRFIGTNVLNEAFLERFPVTFEQDYPSPSIETKILGRAIAELLVLLILNSVKDLLIGVTSFVKHSMMVVLKRSSLLVVWFTSYVHTLSSMIR